MSFGFGMGCGCSCAPFSCWATAPANDGNIYVSSDAGGFTATKPAVTLTTSGGRTTVNVDSAPGITPGLYGGYRDDLVISDNTGLVVMIEAQCWCLNDRVVLLWIGPDGENGFPEFGLNAQHGQRPVLSVPWSGFPLSAPAGINFSNGDILTMVITEAAGVWHVCTYLNYNTQLHSSSTSSYDFTGTWHYGFSSTTDFDPDPQDTGEYANFFLHSGNP